MVVSVIGRSPRRGQQAAHQSDRPHIDCIATETPTRRSAGKADGQGEVRLTNGSRNQAFWKLIELIVKVASRSLYRLPTMPTIASVIDLLMGSSSYQVFEL